AAGGPEQRDELACLDAERDIVDGWRLRLAVKLRDAAELDRRGVALDLGHQPPPVNAGWVRSGRLTLVRDCERSPSLARRPMLRLPTSNCMTPITASMTRMSTAE